MDVCLRMLKESSNRRFNSYIVRNSVLIISHVTFRDCRVHIFPTFLEIAVNILFAVSVPHVHVKALNYALIFYLFMNIS